MPKTPYPKTSNLNLPISSKVTYIQNTVHRTSTYIHPSGLRCGYRSICNLDIGTAMVSLSGFGDGLSLHNALDLAMFGLSLQKAATCLLPSFPLCMPTFTLHFFAYFCALQCRPLTCSRIRIHSVPPPDLFSDQEFEPNMEQNNVLTDSSDESDRELRRFRVAKQPKRLRQKRRRQSGKSYFCAKGEKVVTVLHYSLNFSQSVT